MTEKIELWIDTREEQLSAVNKRRQALEKTGVFTILDKHLEIGDIIAPQKNVCIEVKTISDFYGSITGNNHMFIQASNMAANYENRNIIIIGNIPKLLKGMQNYNEARIPAIINQVLGAYISLMEKYKVPVYWVEDTYQFSKVVEYIVQKTGECPRPKELMHMKPNNEDRMIGIYAALADGIGSKKAEKIAGKYSSLMELSKIITTTPRENFKKQVQEIDGIGETIAERICLFLYGEK